MPPTEGAFTDTGLAGDRSSAVLDDLTCVGIYLKVVEPGPVRLGDRAVVEG